MKSIKYRILFVHHGMGIGGAPISLATLIKALDKSVFSPIVMLRPSKAAKLFESAGADLVFESKFPVFRHTTAGKYSRFNPNLYATSILSPLFQKKWQQRFEELKPDIIHLNSITLLPLCRPAKAIGAKVIVHIRETALQGRWGGRKQWMTHELSTYTDAVIHISQYDKDFLAIKTTIVEVIPNWVDFNQFNRKKNNRKLRETLGVKKNQYLIVTLGGVARIKGTLIFLKSAKILTDQADFLFVVVGMDKPIRLYGTFATIKRYLKNIVKYLLKINNREKIRKFIEENEFSESKLMFLGHRNDIPEILAACDVLVFPVTRPHQARPMLEAAAMAKPVIAPNYNCFKEFVEEGKNGLFFEPANPKALSSAIVKMFAEPGYAIQMGELNYKVACKHHNQEINAPRMHQIYKRLLEK